MAPHWPEEVDVFTVPHSRMKKLINQYNSMVISTDFRDEVHLRNLLENLNNVFNELKAHERIENTYIMKELRSKLRAASISDPAVCNCHSDNRLTEMQDLVLDGYKWAKMPQRERQMYGRKLRQALENFTENFLPHMDMEEQVFQPMLMEYFSYEELKALKVKVIRQHGISKYEESCCEKFVADSYESEESSDERVTKEEEPCGLDCLPDELCLQILSLLGPQDLGLVSQVSRRWANLSCDPKLWTGIFPVHWAMGNWSFRPQTLGEDAMDGMPSGGTWQKEQLFFCTDEDADVDESGGDSDAHCSSERADSEEGRLGDILREAKILTALVKYILPKVGSGVKQCDLAFSRGLSNNLVHKILKLCPNLEILDLRQTLIGDAAFREFGVNGRLSRLRHLDLSGCENISDLTLFSLAPLSAVSTSGVSEAYTSGDVTTCSESERAEDQMASGVVRKPSIGEDDAPCTEISHEFPEAETAHQEQEVELGIESVPRVCQANETNCCGKQSHRALVSERGERPVSCCENVSKDSGAGRQTVSISSSQAGPEADENCCEGNLGRASSFEVREISTKGDLTCGKTEEKCSSCDSKTLPASKECSQLDQGQQANVHLSTKSNASVDCLCPNPGPRQHVSSVGCRSRSNSNEGDPHTCDLSYVYLDMLIQSDESGLTSNPNTLACSLPLLADPSLTEETSNSPYILACDVYQPTIVPHLPSPPSDSCRECHSNSATDISDEDNKKPFPLDHGNPGPDGTETLVPGAASSLEFLSLSGCYRITSDGIGALSDPPGMPRLRHLDLSGCVNVCGDSLRALVSTAPQLDHANLYYCDNLPNDPFPTTASGCRNRGCGRLYCCSLVE